MYFKYHHYTYQHKKCVNFRCPGSGPKRRDSDPIKKIRIRFQIHNIDRLLTEKITRTVPVVNLLFLHL
jgi:hypothetical protein